MNGVTRMTNAANAASTFQGDGVGLQVYGSAHYLAGHCGMADAVYQNTPTMVVRERLVDHLGLSANAETRPLDRVLGRLREYKFLESNWNGYGGLPPTPKAVEECINFLVGINPEVLPEPMIGGTGEVGLFWDSDSVKIEAGFMGNGRFGYLVMFTDGRSIEKEDLELDCFPEAFSEGLEAMTAYDAGYDEPRKMLVR